MNKYFRMFIKSYGHAWHGIAEGAKSELHIRYHLVSAVLVGIAGILTGLTATEWCIIGILIGGMLALELMNSAVERVVDLVTPEFHPLAKQAKDLAAGAVLLFAFTSAIIGLVIFGTKWFT